MKKGDTVSLVITDVVKEEDALFVSTRGAGAVSAAEAVLRGLAPDGGLYADPGIADRPFDVQSCLALEPLGQAERILSHLLPGFPELLLIDGIIEYLFFFLRCDPCF